MRKKIYKYYLSVETTDGPIEVGDSRKSTVSEVDEWFTEKIRERKIQWRVGYMFKLVDVDRVYTWRKISNEEVLSINPRKRNKDIA